MERFRLNGARSVLWCRRIAGPLFGVEAGNVMCLIRSCPEDELTAPRKTRAGLLTPVILPKFESLVMLLLPPLGRQVQNVVCLDARGQGKPSWMAPNRLTNR